jgi:hypothetical protein
VLNEERLDAPRQLDHEDGRVGLGREAVHAEQLPAHEVGHHHVGPTGPYVDRDHASIARVDVEELRLAAPPGVALGAFEDQALGEQLVDQQAHRAAAHLHDAGEIRP